MGRLCSFDGLKITPLGKTSSILIRGEAGGASYARGRVEFTSQDGKKGGPPGLRSVRGPLDWGVGGEAGGKGREVAVEPALEGEPGWELSGGREDPFGQKGGAGVPLGQGPFGESISGERTG